MSGDNDSNMPSGWPEPSGTAAVLISGGLDSAILLGHALRSHRAVHPIYVRNGLSWELAELEHLGRFLDAVQTPVLQPLKILDLSVRDVYEDHWSITGRGVPGTETPDEAVYLPARNVLLLAKAMLWCHLKHIPAVALAILKGNPFPDATPGFFLAYQDAVNRAIEGSVRVLRPYGTLGKVEVMQLGRDLPLELTFSCIRPTAGRHCGSCNKCEERRKAFEDAGIEDQTEYESGK